MMRPRYVSLALGLLCWCAAGSAYAEPLTYYFEGSVFRIHDNLELDESVHIGAPFSGGYSFDPTGVTDYYPDNPNVGSYYFGDAGRMWMQIGNYEFATNDLGMLIWNDLSPDDRYNPISFSVQEAYGVQWTIMSLVLRDESGSALSSDELPLGVPDLSDYPSAAVFALYLPGDVGGIAGRLTSLTPEPGSLVLLALGALAVGHPRRHSRE